TVNHIAGHIYANQLKHVIEFILLALIVSSGHTELIIMKDDDESEIIGETLADAAGEAFDRITSVLELTYPRRPRINQLPEDVHESIDFHSAWLDKGSYIFSFSGLKSSVINHIHNKKQKQEKIITEDIAASFQASVVEVLTEKTYKAATEYNVKQ